MVAKLCNCIEDKENKENQFDIKEQDFADLYVIGKIWIDALKICLTGAELNIFPVVRAAKADTGPPKKPPPMKLSELPLYKSPYTDYKDHLEDKDKCPDGKVKLLHRSLLPYVKNLRQFFSRGLCEAKCFVMNGLHSTTNSIRESKNNFKKTMRDPENLSVRKAVVASGGALGYMLGAGGGVLRRLFYTSAGLLSTGALCFPKETDDIFRNVSYVVGKSLIALYNKWCGKEFNLRERLACRDELPPPPPKRPPIKCPPPPK